MTCIHIFCREKKTAGRCEPEQQGLCGPEQPDNCFGGIARLIGFVRQQEKTEENLIHLGAGDYFQGTEFYTLFKWKAVAPFIKGLHMTATALGNHEFDDGVDGVVPFLESIDTPVVACNIDLTGEPRLTKFIRPSMTVDVNGKKVGIIGYITPDTVQYTGVTTIKFLNEISSVQKEATRLHDEGVSIIVAVGHSGLETDKKMAAEVPLLDVIVGGHSHSLLYSGQKPPVVGTPEGPYPVVVEQRSGHKTLIVHAYEYSKYVGLLKVSFDESGEVSRWEGKPYILDKSIQEDKEAAAEVSKWDAFIPPQYKQELSCLEKYLEGESRFCTEVECAVGSLIADAMVDAVESKLNIQVNGAGIHSGMIRGSIGTGSISGTTILQVMPLDRHIIVYTQSGADIIAMLEWTVYQYDNFKSQGLKSPRMLQLSGIKVLYDLCSSPGQRVKKVWMESKNAENPVFEPIDVNKDYTLVGVDMMLAGLDGYGFAVSTFKNVKFAGFTTTTAIMDYVKKQQPVIPPTVGRIRFSSDC